MTREEARQEIRRNWKRIYPQDKKHKGIICPLCGSGSGKNGTGITEDPKRPGQLTCWAACGFKGDVIDLKMRETGADYNTALSLLADELGISIDRYQADPAAVFAPEKLQAGAEAAQDAQKGRQDGLSGAADNLPGEAQKSPGNGLEGLTGPIIDYTEYYKRCREALRDPAAVSYLQGRGISLGTAAALFLGYDPAWISPTVCRKMEAEGNSWRPAATKRIIIPVSKNHYVARDINPDAPKDFAKMNETGNGKTGIFNSQALRAPDAESIFVVEGAFDALSIIEAGASAVALNSTSNTDLLLKQLEQQPTGATLVLSLDKDTAGRKAQQALAEGLRRLNISYVFADIAGRYKDPNEALTGDRAAFIERIKAAQAQTAAKPDNVSTYISDIMQGEIEKLKASANIKTGFEQLDSLSGGIYPGLYVIAATSSLGKTTFAHQLADNLAAAGHDVLFFSMEQSRLELVSKSLARIAKRDHREDLTSLAIRKGQAPERVKALAQEYLKATGDRMNIIEGNFNCDISFIGEYIRQYIRRNECRPIVFIDYLQILQPAEDDSRKSTKENIDNTVTTLKRISRELDLTVFVISSINRANYLAPIDFESLKESGGIEYTADAIWGLQLQCINDDLFNSATKIKEKRQKIREAKAADPRQIELLCLKNRYGIANYSCNFDYYPRNDLFVQTVTDKFNPFYGELPFDQDKKPAGKRY